MVILILIKQLLSIMDNDNISKVIEIVDDDKILNNPIFASYPKVLYFTAKWCSPCRLINPVYRELAENNPTIKFFKVDVDKNNKLSEMFKIKVMPTFFFFKSYSEYKTFS